MHRLRTTAAAFAATLALGAAVAPQVATAEEPAEPCAIEQAQADRAEAALARVTAVFERQQTRVSKAKRALAAADTARERRSARATLALAKERKAEVAREKRAQQIRVAKANERLEACLTAAE